MEHIIRKLEMISEGIEGIEDLAVNSDPSVRAMAVGVAIKPLSLMLCHAISDLKESVEISEERMKRGTGQLISVDFSPKSEL